ncbi:hypothetical protein FDUTEX481_10109 [Tolypothrix sp. PCC 7601]|nr:hypothetical protein FDUTEX481_10109 [Tolypothrix sp. PCC 7601]
MVISPCPLILLIPNPHYPLSPEGAPSSPIPSPQSPIPNPHYPLSPEGAPSSPIPSPQPLFLYHE